MLREGQEVFVKGERRKVSLSPYPGGYNLMKPDGHNEEGEEKWAFDRVYNEDEIQKEAGLVKEEPKKETWVAPQLKKKTTPFIELDKEEPSVTQIGMTIEEYLQANIFLNLYRDNVTGDMITTEESARAVLGELKKQARLLTRIYMEV
jgi:hypothetical protein